MSIQPDRTPDQQRRNRGAYVYISSGIYAHPAVVRATPAAIVLWVRALSEMNATTRDGTLPKKTLWDLVREIRTNKRALDSLIETGLATDEGDRYCFPKQAGISRLDLWKLGRSGKVRPSVSPSVRARIYTRDGHACVTCSSTERLSIDHIIPWSKGGAHHESNFQTLCMPCNMAKGARL